MTLGVADHLPVRRGPPRPPPDAHPPAKEKLSVVGMSAHGESADLPLDNMLAVTFRLGLGLGLWLGLIPNPSPNLTLTLKPKPNPEP